MTRLWPWLHGLERNGPTPRLSARVRFHEAITEAQSSLEQFSGMPIRPWDRRWLTGILSRLQRIVWSWNWRPAAWATRLRERGPLRGQARVTVGVPFRPGLSLSSSWPRFAAHVGLLSLVAFLVLAGGLRGVLAQPVQANEGGVSLAWQWLQPDSEVDGVLSAYVSIPAMPLALQSPRLAAAEPPLDEWEDEGNTVPGPQRTGVITYTVQEGDTLISIAAQFDLHIETLYWYNHLKSADLLSIDQAMQIPPVDGLIYEVKEGDTLESIAEAYEVRKGNMIAYAPNDLREPYTLFVGQQIFVPGASKPIPRPPVSRGARPANFRLSAPPYASLPGGERFSWPALGTVTDRFGWTGRRWHTGMDIAAPWGTPIYAAAAGTVTMAGWQSGYGYMVEIDHGDGWATRYGHMAQQPDVSVGQWVERNQLIGYIGCTGNCTGPHVHFELRYQGNYANPWEYLQ